MNTRRSKGRRARRGSAIVIALTILTPVLVAGSSIISSLNSYRLEVELRSGQSAAHVTATSGAHQALALLNADKDYRGQSEFEANGGLAIVTVEDMSEDGRDNDGDGLVDEEDESLLISVRSEGWLNRPDDDADSEGRGESPSGRRGVRWYRSVVEATVQLRYDFLPIQQAIYVGDPFSTIDFSGASFTITGIEEGAPEEERVAAIGTPGDPSHLISQVRPWQQGNITGKADPSSGDDTSILGSPRIDVNEWADRMVARAQITLPAAVTKRDFVMGSAENPAIVHVPGDFALEGNMVGTGLLIVDGDLEFSGNAKFRGLILVRGSASFSGGGSGITLRGAMFVAGSRKLLQGPHALSVNGSVDIAYDSGLQPAMVPFFFEGIELVSWRQVVGSSN